MLSKVPAEILCTLSRRVRHYNFLFNIPNNNGDQRTILKRNVIFPTKAKVIRKNDIIKFNINTN